MSYADASAAEAVQPHGFGDSGFVSRGGAAERRRELVLHGGAAHFPVGGERAVQHQEKQDGIYR